MEKEQKNFLNINFSPITASNGMNSLKPFARVTFKLPAYGLYGLVESAVCNFSTLISCMILNLNVARASLTPFRFNEYTQYQLLSTALKRKMVESSRYRMVRASRELCTRFCLQDECGSNIY